MNRSELLLRLQHMTTNWSGKTVLVTGGTGFIGSFLVEALLDAGAKVRVPVRTKNFRTLSERRDEVEWIEGDLRTAEYCTELVRGVDHVFHLASHRRNPDFHSKYSSDVMNGNVQMSLALIQGMKEAGATPSVTFFSTANVPPSSDVIALVQNEKLDGYVLGKALCETLWFAASKQRKFPLLIVRPIGAYGPRDTFTEEGNVIPSLMVKAQKAKEHLDVWGSGHQHRVFLYVEDLIGAVMKLIERDATGIQYIVPPSSVEIRLLAKKIRDLVNPKVPIKFDPSKPDGKRSFVRLPMHESLKSYEWTPLEKGLKETVDWWQVSR